MSSSLLLKITGETVVFSRTATGSPSGSFHAIEQPLNNDLSPSLMRHADVESGLPVGISSPLVGLQLRRLAENGGQDIYGGALLNSHELSDLCMELGEWIPSRPSTGDFRQLPRMVDELEILGGSESTSTKAKTTDGGFTKEGGTPTSSVGRSVKRLASKDKMDDGETPAPSPKASKEDRISLFAIAGTETLPMASAASLESDEASVSLSQPHASEEGLAPHALLIYAMGTGDAGEFLDISCPAASDEGDDAVDLPLSQPSTSLDGVSSEDLLGSSVGISESRDSFNLSDPTDVTFCSSATAHSKPPSATAEDGASKHPFIRVPALQAGVVFRQFQPSAVAFRGLVAHYNSFILLRMRDLLIRPELCQYGADLLLSCAEMLVSHAQYQLQRPVTTRRPSATVDDVGRRFMFLHMLHLASKALKQNWHEEHWWGEFFTAVINDASNLYGERRSTKRSKASRSLTDQLVETIELYRRGRSPPDEEVVEMMNRLFCQESASTCFRDQIWDVWRQDAKSPR
ncbi:hypothetical protein Efla_001936 [Eimeria flavescens]